VRGHTFFLVFSWPCDFVSKPCFNYVASTKEMKFNYLSLSNIWWKSKCCGQVVGLSHFVRPSGYRYMVCPAISSYSFGATALIFCRMLQNIKAVGGDSWTNHVSISGRMNKMTNYLLFWEYLKKIKILWTCTPPLLYDACVYT
jgi:hypothetical protein